LLGSRGDVEDVFEDAYIRGSRAAAVLGRRSMVDFLPSWSRVLTASGPPTERESYIGTWLPEASYLPASFSAEEAAELIEGGWPSPCTPMKTSSFNRPLEMLQPVILVLAWQLNFRISDLVQ
jgi:hypothetical protein